MAGWQCPRQLTTYIQCDTLIRVKVIEFEWDKQNRKHLAAHKVKPAEVEQVLNNDPLERDYELVDDEERYRSVGLTVTGRLLSVIWTIRKGKIRAVTAFPAGVSDTKAFLESSR